MAEQTFGTGMVERLPLPDGKWVEVKREVTVGDTKQLRKLLGPTDTIVRTVDANGNATVKIENDPVLSELAYLFVRLAAWSFSDGEGKPVPLTGDAFDALTVDQLTEVRNAVQKYLESLTPAEGEEKKAPEPSVSEKKSEANSSSAN